MTDILRCTPGQHHQGTDERRAYSFDVGALISAPTAACATMLVSGSNVSSSNLASSASADATISGCIITTPCVVGLLDGTDYTLRVRFCDSSASNECYITITGQEVT